MATDERCVSLHRAGIYDRGGKRWVGWLKDLTEVDYPRERDNTGEAFVKLTAESCDRQSKLINKLRSHRHELVLFRGKKRSWEGPIHRIGIDTAGNTEVVAHDVSEYLYHIFLTRDWDNSYAGDGAIEVTTRLQNILDYELFHAQDLFYPDTVADSAAAVAAWEAVGGTVTAVTGGWTVHLPAWESDTIWPALNIHPYLDIRHYPNEARTTTKTLAYQMTIGQHLTNLAQQSGIDFTTVGRRITIWDVSRPLGRLKTLTEANFASTPIITEYGADHTQIAVSTGGDGTYGIAVNLENMAYYGPYGTVYTDYQAEGTTAPTQGDLNSQARRNTLGRSPAPVEVRIPDNSTLILDRQITMERLVPGVQAKLLAKFNSRTYTQLQKIDSVHVNETAAGENIGLTLTPATKPDSDEV